jgi:transketolase
MSNSNRSAQATQQIQKLEQLAVEIRLKVIKMIAQAGSGHPAGSLGMADIFCALYFGELKHRPNQPDWTGRDYLLLSNGHICPVLYASLNLAGYFPSIELNTLRQINSRLQGHPHLGSLPGVENTSGPLGQGLSQACGLALALKRDKKPNRVICISSDAEQQEGQTWEAYLFAAKYQLNNLTFIIDRNFIQIGGNTEQIMPLGDLEQKLLSFGLKVQLIDGHNLEQILTAFSKIKKSDLPSVIIAQTIPGKGVSFMENKSEWHGKAPNHDELKQAIAELEKQA